MKILLIKISTPYIRQMQVYTKEHLRRIEEVAPQAQVVLIADKKEVIDANIADTDILIFSSFEQMGLVDFALAKNLKWVHLTSAGASDMAGVLKNTDILLTNSSGVHPIPIAEHIFALMLMFTRQIYKSYRTQITKKRWIQTYDFLPISELYGKTIGIVGYGRIGKRVAHVAYGFDMKVLALLHEDHKQDPEVDKFYTQKDFHLLLTESDFVINALPLTPETQNLFNLEKFRQMKKTAYFINIGRGKTVVERDLIRALREGIIKGAGLDVFEIEPLPETSELWNLDNVIITPHYAGWTPRYNDRLVDIFCENLKAFLKHEKMSNLVDKTRGY